MRESECRRCGAAYIVGGGHAYQGEFTTITVSYHDDDRDDVCKSVCAECGDELLAEIVSEAV